MARTVKDERLANRTQRAELAVSGKPYYRALDEGLHLGYRKGKTSGKWVVRIYLDGGKYVVETIGTADDKGDPDGVAVLSFSQAQKVAREKHAHRALADKSAAEPTLEPPYTVRAAIEDYIEFLKKERRTGADARWRADALILPQLGDIECNALKRDEIRAWLDRLVETPPRRRSRKNGEQKHREIDPADENAHRRRRSSTNRTLTILKAALNQCWRNGKIESDREWRAVKPFEDVDAARPRWLNNDDARRLINAAQGEFRKLVQAALQSGARYGALAALKVDDFSVHRTRQRDGTEVEQGTLHLISYKGRGGKVKHVYTDLTEEGIEFFRKITAGRVGKELMLCRDDGGRWLKSHQTRLIKEACKTARIEPPADFHTLRHTWASQAVMRGMPLLVVAQNLGHSDTRMVEKHYGHLAPSYKSDQVRKFAPRFGPLLEDESITPVSGVR
jgi:integrase